MDGAMVGAMIRSYVRAVNSGGVPCIEDAWVSALKVQCANALGSCFDDYEAEMQKQMGELRAAMAADDGDGGGGDGDGDDEFHDAEEEAPTQPTPAAKRKQKRKPKPIAKAGRSKDKGPCMTMRLPYVYVCTSVVLQGNRSIQTCVVMQPSILQL